MIDSQFPTLFTIKNELIQLFNDQIENIEIRENLLIVKIDDIEYYIKRDDFYKDENRHRLSNNDRENNLFISDMGHLLSIRNYFKNLYEEKNQFTETSIIQIKNQLIKLSQDQKADIFDKIINEYFDKELYSLNDNEKPKYNKPLDNVIYNIIY